MITETTNHAAIGPRDRESFFLRDQGETLSHALGSQLHTLSSFLHQHSDPAVSVVSLQPYPGANRRVAKPNQEWTEPLN